MHTVGVIKLSQKNDGQLWEEQHWNPSSIDAESRRQIAGLLRTIADKMDADEFSDGNGYKLFPLKESRDG